MRPEVREKLLHGARNDRLWDIWSFGHIVIGAGLGWIMEPFWALVLMILWEPLEIAVLSPLMDYWFGIEFGYESWRNAVSDIMFDILGVALGAFILPHFWMPPWTVTWLP